MKRAAWLAALVVLPLAAAAAYHAWGVIQDTLVVLGYRYSLDYGEGIVWQQALLMFGPRMYSPSPDLPFIVFHYPPLYYAPVRALMQEGVDPLLAGRLVSAVSSAASALLIAALVLAAQPERPRWGQVGFACLAGLVFLCLDPVRHWGAWMRVDMLAIVLGLAATLVAVRSRGGLAGMTAALLLCTAAVFTKQTHLAAGVSIVAAGFLYAPRNTLAAAAIAGSAGLAVVVWLETSTHGFLKNIIGYNINPPDLAGAYRLIQSQRETAPFILAMAVAAYLVAGRFVRHGGLAQLRRRDPGAIARAVLTIHFALACLTALQIVKEGSSSNYFLDLIGVGCALLGIVMIELSVAPGRLAVLTVLLALATLNLPYRLYPQQILARWTVDNDKLVQLIRDTPKPVASDDMILVLRAGKSLVFEPAIVRVLVAVDRWDPAPLLAMVENHAFGFVLAFSTPEVGPRLFETFARAYPRVTTLPGSLAMYSEP